MTAYTLSGFLNSNPDFERVILDLHQIFGQLVMIYLNDPRSYSYHPDYIQINDLNEVIAPLPRLSNLEKNKWVSLPDLLDSSFDRTYTSIHDFSFLLKCYLLDPINHDKELVISKYKETFVPRGFKVLGYGAHSVVLHSDEFFSSHIFKFSKLDLSVENKIKEILGIPIYYPNLAVPNKYFTSSPLYRKGTLKAYIQNNPNLTNLELLEKFYQICLDVRNIHNHHIILRDIKPDNILLDEFDKPHYADFDVSVFDTDKAYDFTGTEFYMAPEVDQNLSKSKYVGYGVKSDIFSLGCVLNYMFNHNYPYSIYTPLIPKTVIYLIDFMRNPNPDFRPTIDELISLTLGTMKYYRSNPVNEGHFGLMNYVPRPDDKINPKQNSDYGENRFKKHADNRKNAHNPENNQNSNKRPPPQNINPSQDSSESDTEKITKSDTKTSSNNLKRGSNISRKKDPKYPGTFRQKQIFSDSLNELLYLLNMRNSNISLPDEELMPMIYKNLINVINYDIFDPEPEQNSDTNIDNFINIFISNTMDKDILQKEHQHINSELKNQVDFKISKLEVTDKQKTVERVINQINNPTFDLSQIKKNSDKNRIKLDGLWAHLLDESRQSMNTQDILQLIEEISRKTSYSKNKIYENPKSIQLKQALRTKIKEYKTSKTLTVTELPKEFKSNQTKRTILARSNSVPKIFFYFDTTPCIRNYVNKTGSPLFKTTSLF